MRSFLLTVLFFATLAVATSTSTPSPTEDPDTWNDSNRYTVTLVSGKVGKEGKDQITETITRKFYITSDVLNWRETTVLANSTSSIVFSLSGDGQNVSTAIDYLDAASSNEGISGWQAKQAALGFASCTYDDPFQGLGAAIGTAIGLIFLYIFLVMAAIVAGIVGCCCFCCYLSRRDAERQTVLVYQQQPLAPGQQVVYQGQQPVMYGAVAGQPVPVQGQQWGQPQPQFQPQQQEGQVVYGATADTTAVPIKTAPDTIQ